MVEVTKIEKYDRKIEAWHAEEFYTDVKPLHAEKKTGKTGTGGNIDAEGNLDFGSYGPGKGNYAVITAMKYIAESEDTWFSFGGNISDFGYLPAKGVDVIAGSPTDPYVALDEGESATCMVLGAESGVAYAWIIYGFKRSKTPVR